MIIRDLYDGRQLPFEGDRELVLRRLPADARILAARAILTPGSDVEDVLSFPDDDWGTTKHVPGAWVEVDFHARRTLVRVSGPTISGTAVLNGKTLEVDPGGGVWADVNARGTLGGDGAFTLVGDGPYPLPGLTVSRFKLTGTGADVTDVTVRSVPTNVSLRLGGAAPFWTLPGELSQAVTSPDFAAVLQAFLADAEVENGFYAVPLTVHSDTIARLELRFEFEVTCRQSALPAGLDEVALRFDHGGVAVTRSNPLRIAVPHNARVVATGGRATGSFTDSRVAVGPTGAVAADAAVEVSPELAQAQLLTFDETVAADGVDLLLAAVDRTVRLELDFVEDTDGKPGGASLLASPVPFRLERESAGEPTWTSVALPAELQLAGKSWLAVRSLEGTAQLSVRRATATEPSLQQTRDGGLSWRQTSAEGSEEPAAALFRLRHRPRTFRMPIEVLAGEGDKAQRVSLARFDAQERVDLSLGFPELGAAVNRYLEETAPPVCNESEHLANGDFREWIPLAEGSSGTSPPGSPDLRLPAEWSLTSGWITEGELDDGKPAAFLGDFFSEQLVEVPFTALSQVVAVAGSCPYELSFSALAGTEDAVGEVSWLSEDCGLLRTDLLPVRLGDQGAPLLLHRLRVVAPPSSTQAEVRFLVPESWLSLTGVSLRGTQEALLNADFGVSTAAGELVGWQTRPEAGNGSQLTLEDGALRNESSEPVTLVQTVPAKASGDFELKVDGRVFSESDPAAPATAEARLQWLRGDATPTGSVTSLALATPGLEGREARGTVPEDAAEAQVELVLPASTGIQVRQLGLRFPESVAAPLSFVAESPGELAVRDLQLDWEPVEPPPPAIPAAGLCSPTPPGFEPGELADGTCFCGCCACAQKMKKTQAFVTGAGRAVVAGTCASCGEPLVRFGGPAQADATPLRPARPGAVFRRAAAPPAPEPEAAAPPVPEPQAAAPPEPEPLRSEPEPEAATSVAEPSPEPEAGVAPSLSLISGLATRRVERLAEGGIETFEHLAQADPETVRRLLPGISQRMAAEFVDQARKRLAGARGPH